MNVGKGRIIIIGAFALVMVVVFVLALVWTGRSAGRWGYAADSVLAAGLATAVANDPVVALQDLSAFGRFEWDRVLFFKPYTPREAVEERLGASPGFRWHSLIGVTEGYTLIVFRKEGRVVTYFDFPVASGDFSSAAEVEEGLSPQEAIFQVVRAQRDGTKLVPMQELATVPRS